MAIYNFLIESNFDQAYSGEHIEFEADSLEEAEQKAEEHCDAVYSMLQEEIRTWYTLNEVFEDYE